MMKKKFIMGASDGIKRQDSFGEVVSANAAMERRVQEHAIARSFEGFKRFFGNSESCAVPDFWVVSCAESIRRAKGLGLLERGGVRVEDFINLFVLAKLLSPKFYCESGVFIGSSLYAFLSACPETDVLAIDPKPEKIKIPPSEMSHVRIVSDRDFSELNIDSPEGFLYFDDHINPAQRIISARRSGFRYIAIDDGAGFASICQRIYPAVPAIPHILDVDVLQVGDSISWSLPRGSGVITKALNRMKIIRRRSQKNTYVFTDQTLREMQDARSSIERVIEFPDLSDWVVPLDSRLSPAGKKYLLELKH